MNHRTLRKGRSGSMPFAVIAVTLLVVSSAYCAAAASVRQSEDGDGHGIADLSSHEISAEELRSSVEAELGRMLFDVCATPSCGSLDDRGKEFRSTAYRWLELQFPMLLRGITVTMTDYTLDLSVEKLRTEGSTAEGYVPSFLRATGSITAVFESDAGKDTRTVPFSTDGSCALPLTAEMGSLFENAVSGDGTILSQMMDYQLTSLAQYRVINGYGAFSRYGEKGTESILTEADVEKAYRNSLAALSCIYFRDGDGRTVGMVDLASRLVSDDGRITVDLNSVYAQALYSEMDRIVGKWFDYFLGNSLLNVCDYISDTLKNAWDSLTSFVTGRNNFSAEPYLRSVIGDAYTGLRTGQSFVFTVTGPSGEEIAYTVPYPSVDLYGSDVISNFKSNYRSNTNAVREWIAGIVNSAIVKVANGRGMGTVTLSVSGTESFADTLAGAVEAALRGNTESFESVTRGMMESGMIPDQFYSAIYSDIDSHKDSLFTYGRGAFEAMVRDRIIDSVIRDFSEPGSSMSRSDAEALISDSFMEEGNYRVYTGYRSEVDGLMQTLSALREKEESGSTVIRKACTAMLSAGFFALDCAADIRKVALGMCTEFRTNMGINPEAAPAELGFDRDFTLTSGDRTYTERLTVATSSSPSVSVGFANGLSTHFTGFGESRDAPFCTVFPVTLEDRLRVDVSSAGSLMQALGLSDSVYSDTVEVRIGIEVAVVSGWGLSGVDYPASTDVLRDLYNLLLKALEPLLEPLRELLSMAEDLLGVLSEAIMTVSQYVNEIIEKVYDRIFGPLEKLSGYVSETLTVAFCDALVSLIDGAQAVIDVSAVSQIVGFTYMGYTLKFTFNLKTLENYTKYLVKAEFSGNVSGVEVNAFLNVKTKGEEKRVPCITGGFNLKGDGWDLSAEIDPTMAVNKHIMSLSGTVKGIRIDAVLPEAVQYNEVGIALSDFPGIAQILSNIPSPIAGTKIELDAGLSLKYNFPLVSGVLVNEFEPNPEGTDKDREWAEILNLTGSAVDLNDWTITTSKKKVHIIKDLELAPGERAVIYFPGTFLVNSKEYLILKDPDGVEIDRSATMTDSRNDGATCQRAMDGSTDWSLMEGTEDAANKGGLLGTDGILRSVVVDVVKRAAVKAMTEMRHVYSSEALAELISRTVRYAVDDGINRLSSCLVEGSAYVSVDFTDLVSANRTGFRVYLAADKELVGDVLKFLLGKIEALLLGIGDPYNIDLGKVLYEDVFLGVTAYGGIKLPKMLNGNKEFGGKVLLGVDIAANIAALGGLLGHDLGTPKVKARIGITNCPYEVIPKAMGVKKNMTYDLWLLSMTFTPA